MRLAIIGSGHVGLVTGACLAEKGHEVLCTDSNEQKIQSLQRGEMPIYEPGLEELVQKNVAAKRLLFSTSTEEAVAFAVPLFICVGTPSLKSGAPELYYVEKVAKDIAQLLTEYRLIVDKSTVPVMTGTHVHQTIERYSKGEVPFDVASCPEFLREGSAIQDTLQPERIIIGADTERARSLLQEIFEPFGARTIVTDISSAELIKHASNSFLAMKVSFINAISRICDLTGADVEEVAQGMGLDPRIGEAFLRAGIGYGGYCFPKDVLAFSHIAEELGVNFPLLRATHDINIEQLDCFVEKIRRQLWILRGKTFALWGLSFKPNTDDVRESPALGLARKLISEGVRVRAYDPAAGHIVKDTQPDIEVFEDKYEALDGADALVIATEWDEFAEADLAEVKKRLLLPAIFDGRNLLDPDAVRKAGLTYYGVGRGRAR